TLQTQGDFLFGETLTQGIWRGNEGFVRTVPVHNGVPSWGNATLWNGPILIAGFPGAGDMQADSNFIVGSTLRQSFWRGNQGYSPAVPLVEGAPQWKSASAWSPTTCIGALPGSGQLQTVDEFVFGATVRQAVWRGNLGYVRTVPIENYF